MTALMVVDCFAGPGGWDEGMRLAGYTGELVGIEWDAVACRTAEAAGHARIQADVAALDPTPWAGCDGLLSSPPCQAWSRSGKRGGVKDQPRIFQHLHDIIRAGAWVPYPTDGWHDDRSPLVLEVVRWADALQPRWIACEQVEDVLPFWELVARWLRTRGYSVWTGLAHAEEHGVAQTRVRAVLSARRDGVPAAPPVRTHRRYYPPHRAAAEALATAPDLFDTELLPWISMASALGWDDDGVELQHQRGRGMAERHGDRPGRGVDEPAFAITGTPDGSGFGSRLQWVVRTGNNTMNSSRTGSRDGDGGGVRYERPVTDPAPTLDTNVGGKWRLVNNNRPNSCSRGEDEPSGTLYFGERSNYVHWARDRPSTTVQADPRIGRPGHKDREGGESQFERDSVRVSVQEAAILQGFREDYPWQGTSSQRYQCIGNAVPPPMAAAVVTQFLPAKEVAA